MKLITSWLKINRTLIAVIATTAVLAVLGALGGTQNRKVQAKSKFKLAAVPSSLTTKTATLSPDYTVTTSSGSSIVPGTTDIGNHCDDCMTRNIALPFPVIFYDRVFTTFSVSSDGHLTFTDADDTDYNFCLPHDIDSLIVPLEADLYTTDSASGQGIFTSVSGS